MGISEARAEVECLLDAGQWRKAIQKLQILWQHDPGPAAGSYIASVLGKCPVGPEFPAHRCAILRSFSVEPLVPILRSDAISLGINLSVYVGEFNAYAQEILDASSTLYAFAPDTVILAVQARDIAPELWNGTGDAGAVERVTAQFETWIRTFRGFSSANLVIHGLECPIFPAQGVYDSQLEENQAERIRQLNRNLRKLTRDVRGVYFLDYDGLVARHGRQQWGDERKWLTVRLPIAAPNLVHMAREWMRFLAPLAGRSAKIVAVDLDNTLWGGVIGEDGLSGIQVGPEYPGAAFQELQRALLDLSRRGILLAICSKNNYEDALEALTRHPGMLLRPGDLAAMRINWNDKAQNLREIAAELNLGLDSIAFLDDNPVERQQVREQAPEVMVVELPSDPMRYAAAVRDCPAFERLVISEEDSNRGKYYAAEKQREALEQTALSREDFLRSLQQEAEVAAVDQFTLARAAQLTQKTNQFNLTTRRYTEQQLAELARMPGWHVHVIKVRDRYADNGWVGVAITHDQQDTCEIEAFLLSCRVIGRSVETALVAHLASEARARGMHRLQGWFLPTRKNGPAKEFYRSHGFELSSQTTGGELWSIDLECRALRCPEWVRVLTPAEKT